MSPQPWSLKPIVYWCCQIPCSDRYHLPSDGPSTRRLQIEVRICRGLWHFGRYELPERCDHLLHIPLKFISKLTCDEARRVCEPLVEELWANAAIYGHAGWKKWTVWLHLCTQSSMLPPPVPMFQIHLWGPLYGCMLFLLFLIKRKYWCLPDLLIGAIEKFIGCVFLTENASGLSPT